MAKKNSREAGSFSIAENSNDPSLMPTQSVYRAVSAMEHDLPDYNYPDSPGIVDSDIAASQKKIKNSFKPGRM